MRIENLFDRFKSLFTTKSEIPVDATIRRTQEMDESNSPLVSLPWFISPEAWGYLKEEGQASRYISSRRIPIIEEPHNNREAQFGLYKFLDVFFRDNPDLVRRSVFLAEGYPALERLSLQPLIEAEPNPSEELIREVLNSFLITGYMAYEWKFQKNIPIVGVEDGDIYELCVQILNGKMVTSERYNIINDHLCAKNWRGEWEPVTMHSSSEKEYDLLSEIEKKLTETGMGSFRGNPDSYGSIIVTKDSKPHIVATSSDKWNTFVVARNKSIAKALIEKTRAQDSYPILFVGRAHLSNFSLGGDIVFDVTKMSYSIQRAMRINDLSMYSEHASPFARISPERFLNFENKGIEDYLEEEGIGFIFLSTINIEKPEDGKKSEDAYNNLFEAQISGNYKAYIDRLASELKVRRDATTVRPNPEAAAWFVKAIKAIRGDARPPFIGIGDPRGDSKFYKEQHHRDTCAVVAQEEIIHKLIGKDPGEETLRQEAQKGRGYEIGAGTDPDHLGDLLELHGIPTKQIWGASIDDLKQELEHNNKVLVGIDPDKLWYNINGRRRAHAVWVTGLRTDPKDGRIISVAMNDSGNIKIDGGGEVPVDRFIRAWKNLGAQMVATRYLNKF